MKSNDGQHWTIEKQIILGSLALFLLSALDAILTLYGLSLGVIHESNPIMHRLITRSPMAFMAAKLVLPVILGLVFWRIRERSRWIVNYGLWIVLRVYLVVLGVHGWWIISTNFFPFA